MLLAELVGQEKELAEVELLKEPSALPCGSSSMDSSLSRA